MLYVDNPTIFLAVKYILSSKLGYIHKKQMNSFTSLAMQDLHLSFFHTFFVRFVLPLYLKVCRMVTV